MTKVKICCIQSIAEAKTAIENGAYAIGLVSIMPSGPGVISESKIKEKDCFIDFITKPARYNYTTKILPNKYTAIS
jgi:phosphoribosylanthranilate isomerase